MLLLPLPQATQHEVPLKGESIAATVISAAAKPPPHCLRNFPPKIRENTACFDSLRWAKICWRMNWMCLNISCVQIAVFNFILLPIP